MKWSQWIAVSAVAAASAGCTYAPYDRQIFANTSSPVSFNGCSVQPNSSIKIYAGLGLLSPGGIGWTQFATTTSPATATTTDSRGVTWYCWDLSMPVPRQYWFQNPAPLGGPTPMALIRTSDNGAWDWTYNNDPNQCTKSRGYDQLTNAAPCAVTGGSPVGGGPGSVLIMAQTW